MKPTIARTPAVTHAAPHAPTHAPTHAPARAATRAALAAALCAMHFTLSIVPPLAAADYTFNDEGAPPVLNPGDTVTIGTGGTPVQYTGNYFDPRARQLTSKTFTAGEPIVTYMPFALGKSYDTTLKPAGDGTVWAHLDGDRNHQLITVTEPTDGPAQITIDKVAIVNGYGANGGGLRVVDSGAPGTGLTITGDLLFANNQATNRGGAVQTPRGSMTFAGDVFFLENHAPTGGAISFGATGQANEKLTFKGDAIFVNNWSTSHGGAIWGADDSNVHKTLLFEGAAIFTGNRSGVGATATRHGGAIGGGTTGEARFNITFLNDVSFTRNVAQGGNGGAIWTVAGNVVFGGPGQFEGARIYFSRNIATVGTSAARHGGGAINAGTNNGAYDSGVYFINPTARVRFEQNISPQIQFDGTTGGSDNSGLGGAIRANGGIYLLQGESFEFVGNQGTGRGGAFYINSGNLPTGYEFRDHGIIYEGNTNVFKYKVQINGNALFQDNVSRRQGGAISTSYEAGPAAGIYIGGNTRFINNMAGNNGGAICFNLDNGFLTLDATLGDITFMGNRQNVAFTLATPTFADVDTILSNTTGNAGYMTVTPGSGTPNDIHFTGAGKIDVITPAGRTVYMDGGIRASGGSTGASATITKTGAGSWIFGSGADSTGLATTTHILGGTFKLDNATYGNGSGRFYLGAEGGSGATLAGYGTLREPATAYQNFNIIIGELNDTLPRTFAFASNLTITSGTLKLDLFNTVNATAAPSDSITVGGAFQANGITTIDATGPTGLGNGAYTVLTAASAIQGAANNFRLLVNGATPTKRNEGSHVTIDASRLIISSTMYSLPTTWNGAPGGTWRDGPDPIWTSSADTSEKYFRNTDSVTFTDTGAGAITIDPGISGAGVTVADMTINAAADYTFAGAAGITTTATITGAYVNPTQKLTKKGAGTLTFRNTGLNLFAGGIDLEAGALAFNNINQINTGTAPITFTGDATLRPEANNITLSSNIAIATGKTGTLDMGASNLAHTGTLSGAGTLAKTGSATLTLSANSSAFAGALHVRQGVLTLAPTARLGGAITLENATRLDGSGASTGSLNAKAGSIIHVGAANNTTPQTLTLNNLTMDGATLRMDLYAHASTQTAGTADTLALTGAYTPGAASNTLDIQTLKVGEYNLGNLGAFAGQAHTVLIGGQSQVGARQTATIADISGDLILTTTSDDNRRATWSSAAGGIWNISAANWTLDTSVDRTFAGGDSVHFDDTAGSSARTIIVEGSDNVSSMTVAGAANYTFTGGAIKADSAYVWGALITGDGQLHKTGAGALTFENESNTFRGGIDLNAGSIAFNNGNQLNTAGAGISFTGDATLIANAASLTLAENITIADSVTATINTNGHTLACTGALSAGNTASTLLKTGSGTLCLTANNSNYDSSITVAAGALLLSGSQAALGCDVTVGTGATFGGVGAVSGNITARQNATIQVGAAASSGTLSMSALTLASQGLLTGNGELRAGTIALGSAPGDIIYAAIAPGETLKVVTAGITGNALLVKQDAGTLSLSGTGSLLRNGTTQITGGTLRLADYANNTQTSAARHTFIMDGGWLELGSTGLTTTANWTNIIFQNGANAAAGGITTDSSSFVSITLGSGTYSFNIGKESTSNTAERIGVYVDPGAGQTTWLTGSNNYNAPTDLRSGKLVITDAHQLGSLRNTGTSASSYQNSLYLYEATELHLSGTVGTTINTTRPLRFYGSATVTVDAGVESTWLFLSTLGAAIPENVSLTKQGEGTLVISSAGYSAPAEDGSTFTFRASNVNLAAGTLAILNPHGLGAENEEHGATINITGNNTTLRLGNRVNLANPLNLNDKTTSLDMSDPDGSATYSGNMRGTGGINKTGAGELVLNTLTGNPNTYSGATNINEGVLRVGHPNVLSPNSTTYNIAPNATFHLDGHMYRLNTINNKGTLFIGHASTRVEVSNTVSFIGSDGSLITDSHGTLHKTSKLTLDEYHGSSGSRLILNWGLASATDYRVKFDSLSFTPGATLSGTTTIVFAYQGYATSKMNRRGADLSTLDHNIVDDNVQAGLHFTGTFVVNNIIYAFKADEYDDLVIEKLGVVPEVVAAKGIDALALFSNKAALDSLNHRFTSLRSETGPAKRGFDAWLGGVYREDTLRDTIYDGFTAKTHGVQAGFDFIDRDTKGGSTFFIGASIDYLSSTLKSDIRGSAYKDLYSGYLLDAVEAWSGPTRTENTACGVGIYGGMKDGPWYIEAMMRASKDKYRVRLPLQPGYRLDMDGSSFGGSLGTGYTFTGSPSGWVFEPQLQVIMQRSTVDPTFDNSNELDPAERGMIYNIDTIQSMAARVGVKIMKPIEWKPGCLMTPYVRGSILHEFAARNKLTVNAETEVESDLSGSVGILEAGLTWRLTNRWDASLDAGYYYGNKYYGCSLNAGIRFNW